MASALQTARFFIDTAAAETKAALAAATEPRLKALLTLIDGDLAPVVAWIDAKVPLPVPSQLLKYTQPLQRIDYELRGATFALMFAGLNMSPENAVLRNLRFQIYLYQQGA